jgi:hypothetical protein
MKTYTIIEYRPATLRWKYTVSAETKDEALMIVMMGDVDSENFSFEETPDSNSKGEFEIIEELPN